MLQAYNFRNKLFAWSDTNPREYPWIGEKDPYKIWISEIMLQQTRSDQALPYYIKFINRFPDIQSLAQAGEDEVFSYWEGLGYYSRARNAHNTARELTDKFKASFPETEDKLLKLKGIGPYTAAAISSFAFNQPAAVIDGNVIRVFSRLLGLNFDRSKSLDLKAIREIAAKYLDKKQPGKYNQALMNFGASCCTPKKPLCASCSFNKDCYAYQKNVIALFPKTKAKKANRQRHFHFFYIKDKTGSIAINRRTGKDIWKGLYQLPLVETDTDLNLLEIDHKKLKSLLEIKSIPKFFKFSHSMNWKLTHQLINCRFYLMNPGSYSHKIKKSITFVEPEQMQKFAFPRIIHRFFEYLNKNPHVK